MHAFCLMLALLFASEVEKNFGYTPNRAASERFVEGLQERRRHAEEQREAEIVADWFRRNRAQEVISQPRQVSPPVAFVVLSGCIGFGLTLMFVAFSFISQENRGHSFGNAVAAAILNILGVAMCLAGFALIL